MGFIDGRQDVRLDRGHATSSSATSSPAPASSPTPSASGEVLPRCYPNRHGGQQRAGRLGGDRALDLAGNAPRVAEEAAALLTAPSSARPRRRPSSSTAASSRCRSTSRSATRPSSTACSATRPRSPARRSSTLDDVGTLRYGSEHVNVTADATVPGSLGSFGWDDEGVPAQRDYIVDATACSRAS